jgi:TatD DNase family protein
MALKIIDTHSHMYLDAFDEDRDACMARAAEAGVYLTALPNIDVASIAPINQMMTDYPNQVIGMMGLHPCSVGENYKEQLDTIYAELKNGGYHAVGEIGIDLYWDQTHIAEQKKAFRIQIGWAKELSLPIVIHARDSFAEIFEILDEEADENLRGIFHCFSGNAAELERALQFENFLLGMGGVLTFKNSGLDKVMDGVNPKRLVLETDAPYLTPHPYRGKRNETAYTALVAEKLATILRMPLEEVAKITTDNAKRLFKLDEYR